MLKGGYMISMDLEIMYPPFNIQIFVIVFLLEFSQNLPGCYPVASLLYRLPWKLFTNPVTPFKVPD